MAGTAASILNRLVQNASRPKKLPNPPHLKPHASILSALDAQNLPKSISILKSTPSPFPPSTYIRLLNLCSLKSNVVETRRIESHIVSTSYPSPPTFLLNRTIKVYASLGHLKDARELFDEMPEQNTGSYNTMISAYVRGEQPGKALFLFSKMNSSGFGYTDATFASVLSACGDVLDLGLTRQVHGLIEKSRFCKNVILATALVDVYGRCWVIKDARRLFDSILKPNEISWNVIVRRYLDAGKGQEAVCMFCRMMEKDVRPLNFTVSNALIACSNIEGLEEGLQIHGIVVKICYEEDTIVGNSLIQMYLKCGVFKEAHMVFNNLTSKNVISWTLMVWGYAACGNIDIAMVLFNEMRERNVISWNALLTGYVRLLRWEEGLAFFHRMQMDIKEIDSVTLVLVINICAGLLDLSLGKQIHGFAYRHGFALNQLVSNGLLDLYSKCGSLRSAEFWFFQMGNLRDRISWNILLSGYARYGRSEEALDAFRYMQGEISPNVITLSAMLGVCADTFALEFGKQIHGYMFRIGCEINVVSKELVNMYSKCLLDEYAAKVKNYSS